jgi:homoserine kinase type II
MAVYTDISDEELDALLEVYDIGQAVSCKGVAEGVENSNFMLQTERGDFFLTLYEKRVNADDLPFFLGLIEHLHRRGIPCPRPIHDRNGDVLHQAAGRPAAIVTFLKGRWPKRPRPVHCAGIGRAMAELHTAAIDFGLQRPNSLSIESWRPLFDASKDRANEVHGGLAADLERELDELEEKWPTDLPRGVIHADLFPDNVLFLGEKLSGLIDFYFACNDFLVYDLAICLNAWCFEQDGAFNVTKARLLLQAYRMGRSITEAEYESLPILARGAAMRFLLTRLYDWLNQQEGAMVKPKDPLEYYAKIRFHRDVKGLGAYGLDF